MMPAKKPDQVAKFSLFDLTPYQRSDDAAEAEEDGDRVGQVAAQAVLDEGHHGVADADAHEHQHAW